ncbi:ATP-binding protein, partial [Candidatus Fermentibacteria bacterium]|nr:ATP-binding protein [Candidatus Fermentibacteria bacterium]
MEPWSLIVALRLQAHLREIDQGDDCTQAVRRVAVLMGLAMEAMGDASFWVVWEWLRCLCPSCAERETIGSMVKAARAGRPHGLSRGHSRWAARLNQEELCTLSAGTATGVLWLPVGIPASGKSHWVRRRRMEHVVSMDDIRRDLTGDMADQRRNNEVFQIALDTLRQGLSQGLEMVFDATNVDPDARRAPLAIAAERG